MNYPKFKVCVRCFTFNQADYIEDAMNGFTMQQTDFPFVCCIVDDASTDKEQKVIKSYMDRNFNLSDSSVSYKKETDYANIIYAQHNSNNNCFFAVLFLKENLYSKKESYKKFEYISEWSELCEYEAMCEGDDYWIESKKIQKQVEFLDNNSSFAMCYSSVSCYSQQKKKILSQKDGGPYESFRDLLNINVIPTPSTLMRRSCELEYLSEIRPETRNWLMGDYPRWLYYSYRWKIKYMKDEVFAVYRVLGESASHSTNYSKTKAFVENTFEISRFFAEYFNQDELYNNDNLNRNLFLVAFSFGKLDEALLKFKIIKNKSKSLWIKYIICHSRILYNILGKFFFVVIK